MTLRRKLAVTTIAASVAMSAFAGIPLSSKGLSEKLGLSGVVSAATYSDFITEANKVYAQLTVTERGYINDFREEIELALENNADILTPLVEKLSSVTGIRTQLSELVEDLLATPIDSNWQTAYEDLRDDYDGLLNELHPGLSVDDLASVFLKLETDVASLIADLTLAELADFEAIKDEVKLIANTAIASNPDVAAYAGLVEFTASDLAGVYSAIQASPEVHFATGLQAFAALNRAYKAAHASTGGGGGGGDTTIPSTPIDIPQEAKDLENKLGELKDKLASATDEEKAELIAEAVKEAQAVVDKLSNIEAAVAVVDGKATLQLDDKKALSAIAGIAAAAAALKDATGEEIKSLKFTIDLGEVDQDEVAVGLSTAVVEEAIKANLAAVAFVIDDLTVELPVGGQFNKAVDLTVSRSEATPEVTGGQTPVSSVYDFSVNVGGEPITVFEKPVKLQLPVDASDDIDTDLLTLAKIIEEKLAYYGGRYSNGVFTEARDSFSSYVVVENKVSFDDTASVDAWAGRAIEVIAAKGAINGKAEGVFDPSANVTRAEFAKMLIHALDLDNQTAKEKFADVDTGDWFAPYVAAASEAGIINGRSATKFDPSAKITRAEMATMVTRALKYAHGTADVADLEEALAGFSDADQISDALAQGVAFAANYGIVVGNEGKFAPNANATRAQAAVIIYRAFNFEE